MSAYSASPPDSVWSTQDGRRIPVGWMQTQHLCHSFNMLLRKNSMGRTTVLDRMKYGRKKDILYYMVEELKARGVFIWKDDRQIQVDKTRETSAELCIMRAVIDTKYAGEKTVLTYDWTVSTVEETLARGGDRLKAKFAEYRLDYPG